MKQKNIGVSSMCRGAPSGKYAFIFKEPESMNFDEEMVESPVKAGDKITDPDAQGKALLERRLKDLARVGHFPNESDEAQKSRYEKIVASNEKMLERSNHRLQLEYEACETTCDNILARTGKLDWSIWAENPEMAISRVLKITTPHNENPQYRTLALQAVTYIKAAGGVPKQIEKALMDWDKAFRALIESDAAKEVPPTVAHARGFVSSATIGEPAANPVAKVESGPVTGVGHVQVNGTEGTKHAEVRPEKAAWEKDKSLPDARKAKLTRDFLKGKGNEGTEIAKSILKIDDVAKAADKDLVKTVARVQTEINKLIAADIKATKTDIPAQLKADGKLNDDGILGNLTWIGITHYKESIREKPAPPALEPAAPEPAAPEPAAPEPAAPEPQRREELTHSLARNPHEAGPGQVIGLARNIPELGLKKGAYMIVVESINSEGIMKCQNLVNGKVNRFRDTSLQATTQENADVVARLMKDKAFVAMLDQGKAQQAVEIAARREARDKSATKEAPAGAPAIAAAPTPPRLPKDREGRPLA